MRPFYIQQSQQDTVEYLRDCLGTAIAVLAFPLHLGSLVIARTDTAAVFVKAAQTKRAA